MNNWTYAARLESFPDVPEKVFEKGNPSYTTFEKIDRMAQAKGVTHIEPNYPYHFYENTPEEIRDHAKGYGLDVSGVGLRFVEEFTGGELTHHCSQKREMAMRNLQDGIDACRRMGGTTATIWSTYDGFDYPFQADYGRMWKYLVQCYAEVARSNPDMKISLEYKPYEPRQFYFINDIGTTLLAVLEADCDNLGITLDFAHMLMKKENPAYSLALAAERGKLFGFHLNDGYGSHDDGLLLGSVSLLQTLEFIYYMKRYEYNGVIFFDTFPLREDPVKELELNIRVFNRISDWIDNIGMERLADLVAQQDALKVQEMLVLEGLLK